MIHPLHPITNARGNSFKLYRSSRLALKNARTTYPNRPIRCPHYTASETAILGKAYRPDGDSNRIVLSPGEIHLANHGVLFLQDLPEFRRGVLERLAVMWLAGSSYHHARTSAGMVEVAMPLSFDIVATAEFCPCAVPDRCTDSKESRQRFEDRITFFVTLLEEGQNSE